MGFRMQGLGFGEFDTGPRSEATRILFVTAHWNLDLNGNPTRAGLSKLFLVRSDEEPVL